MLSNSYKKGVRCQQNCFALIIMLLHATASNRTQWAHAFKQLQKLQDMPAASCYCFKQKTVNHFKQRLQQIIQILQMDAPRPCEQEATRLLTLQSKQLLSKILHHLNIVSSFSFCQIITHFSKSIENASHTFPQVLHPTHSCSSASTHTTLYHTSLHTACA